MNKTFLYGVVILVGGCIIAAAVNYMRESNQRQQLQQQILDQQKDGYVPQLIPAGQKAGDTQP